MSDVIDNTAESRFELDVGVGEPAIIAYDRDGGRIALVHTVVPEAASGQGAGSRLVHGALVMIRAQGLRVIPQCSFVAAYIERHPEERDLLA